MEASDVTLLQYNITLGYRKSTGNLYSLVILVIPYFIPTTFDLTLRSVMSEHCRQF